MSDWRKCLHDRLALLAIEDIPSVLDIASARLPPVRPIVPPEPVYYEDANGNMGVLDTSTQLERVTGKALENAEGILDLALDTDPEAGHVMRAKTSVITSVLNTQAKVDETRLRRQSMDRLPALLKMVNEVAAKLPKEPRQIDLVADRTSTA
jgi:hypothetical protein